MESRLSELAAVRAGLGFVGLLALAAVLARTHADLDTGLIGFLGAGALLALTVPLGYAALLGLSGWGLLTGFVVNAGGQLTFAASDLEHLALLVAASTAVAVLRPRARRPPVRRVSAPQCSSWGLTG